MNLIASIVAGLPGIVGNITPGILWGKKDGKWVIITPTENLLVAAATKLLEDDVPLKGVNTQAKLIVESDMNLQKPEGLEDYEDLHAGLVETDKPEDDPEPVAPAAEEKPAGEGEDSATSEPPKPAE